MDRDAVIKKRAARLLVLRRIYNNVNGRTDHSTGYDELLGALANDEVLDPRECKDAIRYMEGQGLLKWVTLSSVTISSAGVRAIEEAILNPNIDTVHFPSLHSAQNLFHIYGDVGAVQTGEGSVANVEQKSSCDDK